MENPDATFAQCICCTIKAFLFVPFVILSIHSVARDRPAFHLNDLHVSLLNTTLNSSTTTMIHFNLTIKNPNPLYGLHYKDPVNLTFIYFLPSINKTDNVTIGRYTIHGFYQGFSKAKHVRDSVVVQDVFSEAKQLKDPAKVARLSVNLDARVKFKSIEHKKINVVARAIVAVNCNTGNVFQNKTNILLPYSGSDKWKPIQRFTLAVMIIAFTVIAMIIVCCIGCCIRNS